MAQWDRDRGEGPQVVLCGSMSSLGVMSRVADHLRRAGVCALLPDPDEEYTAVTVEDEAAAKRRASRAHLDRIRQEDTAAVLVVNVEKGGQQDYVGPNAFAEIAVAFADSKPVYLLHNVPTTYSDELHAWEVTPLRGDLATLLRGLGVNHARESAAALQAGVPVLIAP